MTIMIRMGWPSSSRFFKSVSTSTLLNNNIKNIGCKTNNTKTTLESNLMTKNIGCKTDNIKNNNRDKFINKVNNIGYKSNSNASKSDSSSNREMKSFIKQCRREYS